MSEQIPWDELDPEVVDLVRAINEFPGLETVSSCGGHEIIDLIFPSVSVPVGRWYVTFTIDRSLDSLLSLEFLAWIVRDMNKGDAGSDILLVVDSLPPFLNGPGTTLFFVLERAATRIEKEDAASVAAWITKLRDEHFIDAADLEADEGEE